MSEPLPSVALIAEGKCPGWWSDGYSCDLFSDYCGAKITRGDLCGTHDNVRKRRLAELDRREIRKMVAAQAQRDQGEAVNLAMMIGDALRARGAEVTPTGQRGQVVLERRDAYALLNWLRP
jgi:hypothetical protein